MKNIVAILMIFVMLGNLVDVCASEIKNPSVVSDAVILMDAKTGRVLFEKNMDKPLAMASTTKIMTAIIALENGNLEDIVSVSKNATKAPEVKMNLQEGEEISLLDLLYALMLQSSNDCAIAIAEHIGGDVANFCNMMTEKAEILGAKDTLFVTPNGLDEGDHHSTAYDMALISRYALQNEKFMEIINTQSVKIKTNKKAYDVNNKNAFLNLYDGANGMKTGYTNKAGYCFVGSALRGDMNLICVVLASGWGATGKTQKWKDSEALLDYGFDNFEYIEVLGNRVLGEKIQVLKGSESEIGLYYATDLIAPLREDEVSKVNIVVEYLEVVEAPIYKDEIVGNASVYIDNELLGKIDILADTTVLKNTFFSNLGNIVKLWCSMVNI